VCILRVGTRDWSNDPSLLAPIDKYDVAGVAVTRGGREETIGGLIMPIEGVHHT